MRLWCSSSGSSRSELWCSCGRHKFQSQLLMSWSDSPVFLQWFPAGLHNNCPVKLNEVTCFFMWLMCITTNKLHAWFEYIFILLLTICPSTDLLLSLFIYPLYSVPSLSLFALVFLTGWDIYHLYSRSLRVVGRLQCWADEWGSQWCAATSGGQTRQLFSDWTRHIAFLLLFSNCTEGDKTQSGQ